MTLTKENAKTGMTIISKSNPERGDWKLDVEKETIKGFSGERMLFESEYKFWEIVK